MPRDAEQDRNLARAGLVERNSGVGLIWGVHKRDKARQLVLVGQDTCPFVLISGDMPCHCGVQIGTDPQRVLAHHIANVIETTFDGLPPYRCALEPIGGADVEHQVPVDVADEGLAVEVAASSCACFGLAPPLPPT